MTQEFSSSIQFDSAVVNMAALRFLFANTYSINCIAWAESVQLELYEVWYTRNRNSEIGDGKVKQGLQ